MEIKQKSRSELKAYFQKNSIPTESNFAELIDGMLNHKDDGIAKTAGNPLSIQADNSTQKKTLNFYDQLQDETPAWSLSLNPKEEPANPASANKAGLSFNDNAGNSRLFIDKATGNIGIGTISPKGKLDIKGVLMFNSNADTTISGQLRGSRNTVVLDGHWGELEVKGRVIDWTGSNLHIGYDNNHSADYIEMGKKVGHIRFLSGGGDSETMRVTEQKVGIGTGTPQAKLHIDGNQDAGLNDANKKGLLVLGNTSSTHLAMDANEIMALKNGTQAGTLYLQVDGGNTIIGKLPTGKVGIGTESPQAKLHIKGSVKIEGQLSLTQPIAQQAWQGVSFRNGWKNYGSSYNSAGYYKDSDGIVHLKGMVKGGQLRKAIFVLPVGYRPVRRELHATCTSPDTIARLDIEANGNILMWKGSSSWITLDGITFRAAPLAFTAFINPGIVGVIRP